MATGFKQATVNASDVPATQTNFPSYVDLSRLGITTLAEAQSVRCYSDSTKTTELAREIVSVTEMHVKVSSLTSTFVLYVDWDGTSADYAVTDTYGRNAVWSGYVLVSHMYDLTTSTIQDATGTRTISKASASNPNEVDSVFNKGQSYQDSNDYANPSSVIDLGTFTYQGWAKVSASNPNGDMYILAKRSGPTNGAVELAHNTASSKFRIGTRTGSTWKSNENSEVIANNTPYHVVGTFNGTDLICYVNGVGSATTYSSHSVENLNIITRIGGNPAYSQYYWRGEIAEARIRSGALSANWITTEYNNQSDEAGFWGTWTNVGGGSATPTLMMMGIGS